MLQNSKVSAIAHYEDTLGDHAIVPSLAAHAYRAHVVLAVLPALDGFTGMIRLIIRGIGRPQLLAASFWTAISDSGIIRRPSPVRDGSAFCRHAYE